MQFVARFTCYRYRPRLAGVLKLPMTTTLADDLPTIVVEYSQYLTHLH